MAGQLALNKKQGVSGQSVSSSAALTITTVDKDFHTKNLIKEAIQDNDFLKNLTSSQVGICIIRVLDASLAQKICRVLRIVHTQMFVCQNLYSIENLLESNICLFIIVIVTL